MILVFWMLSFKPTFSLSSLTFLKRLFRSSSLSAIAVASSAYLRLLVFLPAVLIPASIQGSQVTRCTVLTGRGTSARDDVNRCKENTWQSSTRFADLRNRLGKLGDKRTLLAWHRTTGKTTAEITLNNERRKLPSPDKIKNKTRCLVPCSAAGPASAVAKENEVSVQTEAKAALFADDTIPYVEKLWNSSVARIYC